MITRGRRRRLEKGNLAGSSIVGGNNTMVSIPDQNRTEENSNKRELGRDQENWNGSQIRQTKSGRVPERQPGWAWFLAIDLSMGDILRTRSLLEL
jgi:hypothetical protein